MKKLFTLILFSILVLLPLAALSNDSVQNKNNFALNIESSSQPDSTIDKATLEICEDNSEEGTLEIARRGCCSHHGGVCGCDKEKDKIVCCDGTYSRSCTCSGY